MAQAAEGKTIAFHGIHPIFLVTDVVKTAEWYRDVLGFQFDRFWGEPPCFCMVRRDNVEVFLKGPECPGETVTIRTNRQHKGIWDAYINVSNADKLYAELKARGATIIREPEDQVYMQREFEVEDINGYGLCFAQDTSGES
jgi:uncharacterized glyoxalase superfamily protein PhnB